MNSKMKLHLGEVNIQLGFWVRIYLWLSRRRSEVDLPVNSFVMKDITIEVEGGIDEEAYKQLITEGNTNTRALASFIKPYLVKVLDKYVLDVTE